MTTTGDKELGSAAKLLRIARGFEIADVIAKRPSAAAVFRNFEKSGTGADTVLKYYADLFGMDMYAAPDVMRQQILAAAEALPKEPVSHVVFGQALQFLMIQDGRITSGTDLPDGAGRFLGLDVRTLGSLFEGRAGIPEHMYGRTARYYHYDSAQALIQGAQERGFVASERSEEALARVGDKPAKAARLPRHAVPGASSQINLGWGRS